MDAGFFLQTIKKELFSWWRSPSFYVSLLLLTITLFLPDLLDLLTPFIFPFLYVTVWALFVVVSIGTLVNAYLKKEGEAVFHRFKFVFLNSAVAVTALVLAISNVQSTLDFNLNFDKRVAVVDMARNGRLSRTFETGLGFALPSGWKYLSRGGVIIVSDARNARRNFDPKSLRVFFYWFRGILDNYNGFEYSANDTPPTDVAVATRLRRNWFWVAN
jgi:hypothetical protein